MSGKGWIKVSRSLLEWEWYDRSEMVHLFLHLLLRANYTESRWRGVTVGRGQLITGRKKLAMETGMSERKVRTCLKNLEATGEVTSEPTNKFSLITLVNYEKFQDDEGETDQQNDQPSVQQKTSKRPANDQQPTTSKEGKKGNKGRNEEGKKTGSKKAESKAGNKKGSTPGAPSKSPEKEEKSGEKKKKRTKLGEDELGPFDEVWEYWLDYKAREKKDSYKADRFERVAFHKLKDLSDNSPETAQRIVDQSISNGWKGLFPLKDQKPAANGKSKASQARSSVKRFASPGSKGTSGQ